MLGGQAKTADTPGIDYVVRGRAIGGFAVVAFPAKYGSSGIMTFIVNQEGKVFEADFGPQTGEKAGAMQLFDPARCGRPSRPRNEVQSNSEGEYLYTSRRARRLAMTRRGVGFPILPKGNHTRSTLMSDTPRQNDWSKP